MNRPCHKTGTPSGAGSEIAPAVQIQSTIGTVPLNPLTRHGLELMNSCCFRNYSCWSNAISTLLTVFKNRGDRARFGQLAQCR